MNSNEGQCPVLGSAKKHGRKWLFLKVLRLSGSALTWYVSCMYFQLGQAVREMREVVWDTFHLSASSLLQYPGWETCLCPCRHLQGRVGNPAMHPSRYPQGEWETCLCPSRHPQGRVGNPAMCPSRHPHAYVGNPACVPADPVHISYVACSCL